MHRRMTMPPRSPNAAGGIFLALGAIGGAVLGMMTAQPTMGLLAGFGAGLAVAVTLWLVQRGR